MAYLATKVVMLAICIITVKKSLEIYQGASLAFNVKFSIITFSFVLILKSLHHRGRVSLPR